MPIFKVPPLLGSARTARTNIALAAGGKACGQRQLDEITPRDLALTDQLRGLGQLHFAFGHCLCSSLGDRRTLCLACFKRSGRSCRKGPSHEIEPSVNVAGGRSRKKGRISRRHVNYQRS